MSKPSTSDEFLRSNLPLLKQISDSIEVMVANWEAFLSAKDSGGCPHVNTIRVTTSGGDEGDGNRYLCEDCGKTITAADPIAAQQGG